MFPGVSCCQHHTCLLCLLPVDHNTPPKQFCGLGDALCSDDDAISAGGRNLWSGSSGSEEEFLLSRPIDKVDW